MEIQVNLGTGRPGWLTSSRSLAHLISVVLGSLIDIDLVYLLSHEVPSLYDSGVRYQREPPGIEEFAAIPAVIERGWGDCDDLAAWRIAELRAHGERATPRIVWRKFPKGRLYHVMVRRAKFPRTDPRSIEDPSKILGMDGAG